ncbi:hypothetical protein DACRYDRAFT_17365 [Dacryopinax primogenitus]|uniref:B box-type domain-containing protein n=1 Tax=Dacryopinax primogenitus (strain DJM 731) TaxID=1858805 RepID=M5FRH8_DACPD|nr:uncharacterized protein DACRYDRAFT_17365 [Dacryopinax primogenitus]EJT99740.1 hypothetical protein DACRYDRAFT_17365 [Dacryopinax primogenitus]
MATPAKAEASTTLSLAKILDEELAPPSEDQPMAGAEEGSEGEETVAKHGFCVECEDQPAQVHCENCEDDYCEVCYHAQHRKGSRKRHASTPFDQPPAKRKKTAGVVVNGSNGVAAGIGGAKTEDVPDVDDEAEAEDEMSTDMTPMGTDLLPAPVANPKEAGDYYLQRARFIPVRLTLGERKYLRLLEAALSVSEYTDRVDILSFSSSKVQRIHQQIKELCSILSGLLLAADYKQGQELFTDRDFAQNEQWFQDVFELGRRFKIMNPDKMRGTYGKLMYLLMDAQNPQTVYTVLEEGGALDLLKDDLISLATREIVAGNRPRYEIQREIKSKERAIEALAARYSGPRSGGHISQETIKQCLYSIGDNHAFLRVNRDPCEIMIGYLKKSFDVRDAKGEHASLAIRIGKQGARLSHDHAKQYAYVLQSLTLWREILHDMFRLWSFAEDDLLAASSPYRLRDTGQGLNRVQPAPKTSRLMHAILHKAQQNIGSWVGSSVIHMGDHNVPNSLLFIDKYSQIYRILLPISNVLQHIPKLFNENGNLRDYAESEYGGVDKLVREILCDFFRHAFDGSGADSYFDAGSCIDGRLTSAWNWCSNIEKKRYFPVFLLCGFVGFDGHW